MEHATHEHETLHQDEKHTGHGGPGGHAGHGDHADMFRRLFWRNLALAVPVLLFSPMIQEWFGYSLEFAGSSWIPVVFGIAIFFDGGRPFLTGGRDEIRQRQPGMMLLIAMAITVAFLASVASVFGWLELEFWWELALLIVIMLLGHWQEMKALGSARSALTALAALLPDEAERIAGDGTVETVTPAELAPGDIVLVRPGARVPADGVIESGQAAFDESMLTGESQPIQHGPGDRVVAGSVATDASVRVEVEAVGEGTALGGIQRLVAEAQESGSRAQALADRAAAALFYVAVGAAVITAAAWLIFAEPADALTRTVAVLVIACPHALGLAIPLVISLSTARAARAGILVRDRLALERMRSVDTVVFDKTGTLTEGSHAVTDVFALDGDTDRLLALAAAAEGESEHPVARGIRQAAAERHVAVPPAGRFETLPGRGIVAMVEDKTVAVGGPGLVAERGITVADEIAQATAPWRERGAAVLIIAEDGRAVGAVALEDRIRSESRAAIRSLRERGVDVVMITGDARQVAEHVASELGIEEVRAEVLPADKDGAIQSLQEEGRTVAMVGDGVNDAPALARADVGVAIGAGTDVAIESAGIVLASDDPRMVVPLIDLSRASYRKMVQNLWWAAGYNLAALPLAAGVLAWAGIVLAPAVGAALMSLSTVIVALNAQLLRRLELAPA